MNRPTLRDIARACGVSTATVSMVLAGKGSISAERSDLIRKTATDLGYRKRGAQRDRGPSFKYVCIIQWEEAPYLWHFSQPLTSAKTSACCPSEKNAISFSGISTTTSRLPLGTHWHASRDRGVRPYA